MYSFTPAVSGNPGILSEQKSTNAWFACATTGVVGQSVSSRSNVMTSTPDDDDDVAAATRADARRDDERAPARRARRGHDVAAARATPRAAAKDVDIPDVGRERALERVDDDDDDDDVDRETSATGRTERERRKHASRRPVP
jgi:hypothetical protein